MSASSPPPPPPPMSNGPAVDCDEPVVPAPDASASSQTSTSSSAHPDQLDTWKGSFRDSRGRTVILRGVNLTAKIPPNEPTHDASHHLGRPAEPEQAKTVSFVDAPLVLPRAGRRSRSKAIEAEQLQETEEDDDTDGAWRVHIARLVGWGFNAVRLAVVWEAIEHAGPGIYDEAYMAYVVQLLRELKAVGLRVFIDPHQDVWSRATGGSGAPYWTLLACGLDPQKFQATQAAIVHGLWAGRDGRTPDEPWPAMVWQTNAFRLACATAFTLFWAGRDFAPKCLIDGVNIQEWLQRHYVDAFGALAKRVADAGDLNDVCVMGWDSMNEPLQGYLGMADLAKVSDKQSLKLGPTPTPLESFRLGAGRKVRVSNYRFGKLGAHKDGHAVIDPEGVSCWLDPEAEPKGISPWGWKRDASWRLGECIWEQHGVWNAKTGELLRSDYFARRPHPAANDRPAELNFLQDYWVPSWQKWNARIRQTQPNAISFVNPPVFEEPPELSEVDQGGRCCLTPHFYDGLTLLNKRLHKFNGDAVGMMRHTIKAQDVPKLGSSSIRDSIREQLHALSIGDTHPDRGLSSDKVKLYPAIIGETGVPFDFKPKDAFFGLIANGGKDSDYSTQEAALDQNLSGCEGEKALGFCLWEYRVDNTHEMGDNWNGEDFSIFCVADWVDKMGEAAVRPDYLQDLLTVGCRAQRAFCRPYPKALVGTVDRLDFNINDSICEMTIRQDLSENANASADEEEPDSILYVPFLHFALEAHDCLEDGATSKPPGFGFPRRTIEFQANRLGHHSHEQAVHLTGRPESKPLLGIRPWSQTAPSAQLDIKLTLDLREGRPATDERLECQVSVEGQHVRLRWAGSGAVGRMRVYELKIERWEARADKPKKVHSLKHPFGKLMPASAA